MRSLTLPLAAHGSMGNIAPAGSLPQSLRCLRRTVVELTLLSEITMGYRGDGEDDRWVDRCARCDAIAFAEPADSNCSHTNVVCDLCGIAMPDLPFVDNDYFNVVMRVGRPLRHGARFRRAR